MDMHRSYRRAALLLGAHALLTILVPLAALLVGLSRDDMRDGILDSTTTPSAMNPEYQLIPTAFYPLTIVLFGVGMIFLVAALRSEFRGDRHISSQRQIRR